MSRKIIKDLLISLSYLKFAIIMTTIIVIILIMVDGGNTETYLSHYKTGYLATNFERLTVESPLSRYVEFLWRYFAELFLGILALVFLLNHNMKIYFLILLLSMVFAFSVKIDIVIIISIEIVLNAIYFVKKEVVQ